MGPTQAPRAFPALVALIITASAVFGFARGAQAQEQPAPAHASVVDGTATLEREDGSAPLTPGMPIVPGDRVRTAGGRAELRFPDGTVLDLDEYTDLDLQSETLLRMNAGRVLLNVAGSADPQRAVRYRIDGPAASLQTESPGEYRLSIAQGLPAGDMELVVMRGAASFFTDSGSMLVRAGERSLARDGYAPSNPQTFNSARFDAFDRWAADRRQERMGSAASAQYLPQELRMYGGTLDHYGAWQYDTSYGYVWYPTVAAGWRPYYNGYWSPVPHYGYTWIGADFWGWPTHHYGRWGYNNRWFWIPQRHYGPAWVSWAGAPGYVSWSPLGYNNYPVFGLSVSAGVGVGHFGFGFGWTAVPHAQFGVHGVYVNHAAVPFRQIPTTRFVSLASAPIPPPRVPHARGAGSIAGPSVANGPAVPRGSLRTVTPSAPNGNALRAGTPPAPTGGARSGSGRIASGATPAQNSFGSQPPSGQTAQSRSWARTPSSQSRVSPVAPANADPAVTPNASARTWNTRSDNSSAHVSSRITTPSRTPSPSNVQVAPQLAQPVQRSWQTPSAFPQMPSASSQTPSASPRGWGGPTRSSNPAVPSGPPAGYRASPRSAGSLSPSAPSAPSAGGASARSGAPSSGSAPAGSQGGSSGGAASGSASRSSGGGSAPAGARTAHGR